MAVEQQQNKDLEDRSRRNNLRFDGITESLNEMWEISEEKILDAIKQNLNIEHDMLIERAHRTRESRSQREKGLP